MNNTAPESYDRDIPATRWGAIAILAMIVAIAGIVAWEKEMRSQGLYPGDLGDGNAYWAVERRKLHVPNPNAIAIIGSSRILFDTDLDIFEQMSGIRPVQLALPGTGPRLFLDDLANDENFYGMVVVGVTPGLFFNDPVGLFAGALDYIDDQSPSQRFGHPIGKWLHRNFAFMDEAHALFKVVRNRKIENREGVYGAYEDVWKISIVEDDRQTRMWLQVEENEYVRDHATHAWAVFMGAPPVPDEDIDVAIENTIQNVEKIRARGGEVVFIRAPSIDPIREEENTRLARERGFDRLIAETNSFGVHFEDHKMMQGLDVPEWSHLSQESAKAFTRAYVAELVNGVDWLRDRQPQGE